MGSWFYVSHSNSCLLGAELCSSGVRAMLWYSPQLCSVSVPGDFLELRRQFTRKQSGMVLMNGIKDSGSGNQSKKGSLLILMKFQGAKCCNKE